MMRRTLFLLPLAMMLSGPLAAQEAVAPGTGAMLRGLDKINASTEDLELATGETGQVGSLEVTLRDCRYPENNPAGDAFAFLTIRDMRAEEDTGPIFEGWMVASSPALNALDHFRYDIWVLHCILPAGVDTTPDAVVPEAEPAPELDPDQPVD
ncbi:DUF2155 domain-containing protein [Ferrimonas balearica]|nr:DUF2155 domain-containing protein [Ferrimonas balearica]